MKLFVYCAQGCSISGLGPYGNEWIATPNLDRLAAEGIVYDRHYSDCPAAAAARRAWWSAAHIFRVVPATSSLLIRACRPDSDVESELARRYFSMILDARPEESANPGDALLHQLPLALDQFAAKLDWLIWVESDRFLPPWHVPQDVFEVYIEDLLENEELDEHGLPIKPSEDAEPPEPLTPLQMPPQGLLDSNDEATWELIQRSFAAAVTSWDAELGQCLDLLRARPDYPDITLLFMSDYGYPLGEHGIVGPAESDLHEALVHLPLILRRAGGVDPGRRVWNFTQPADLAAVLLDTPLSRNSVIVRGPRPGEVSVRTDTHALVVPAKDDDEFEAAPPRLYIKPDDRWEGNDVSALHEDTTEELQKLSVIELNSQESST